MTTVPSNPEQHRQILTELFTQATATAARLGLSPVGVMVRTYEVTVQMSGQDTASVDQFADAYELPADDAHADLDIYSRIGPVAFGGRPVELRVYTGRPAAEVQA